MEGKKILDVCIMYNGQKYTAVVNRVLRPLHVHVHSEIPFPPPFPPGYGHTESTNIPKRTM